ncbi:hypothetical protein ABWH91_08400 [Phycisphaerales bacterium ac7]
MACAFGSDHGTPRITRLCFGLRAQCSAHAFFALNGSDMDKGLDRGEALAVALSGVEGVELCVAGGLDRRHAGHERFERFGLGGDHCDLGLKALDAEDGFQLREDFFGSRFVGGLGCGSVLGRSFRGGVHECTSLTLRAGEPDRRAQEVVMRKGIARIRPVYGRKIF